MAQAATPLRGSKRHGDADIEELLDLCWMAQVLDVSIRIKVLDEGIGLYFNCTRSSFVALVSGRFLPSLRYRSEK